MWNAKTRGRKDAACRHSRVGGNLGGMEGSARVWGMMWVFLRGLPSFLRGLPSFPRDLPSFPRRRESGWYGGECESVGYDVSVGMTEGGAY